MNRLLAVIASLGTTCMSGQVLGADPAGHSASIRRHLSGCMSTRMSASKVMSYYEAMKVCKDRLNDQNHHAAATATTRNLADRTTTKSLASVTAPKEPTSARTAKRLTSVTSTQNLAEGTTTKGATVVIASKGLTSVTTAKPAHAR